MNKQDRKNNIILATMFTNSAEDFASLDWQPDVTKKRFLAIAEQIEDILEHAEDSIWANDINQLVYRATTQGEDWIDLVFKYLPLSFANTPVTEDNRKKKLAILGTAIVETLNDQWYIDFYNRHMQFQNELRKEIRDEELELQYGFLNEESVNEQIIKDDDKLIKALIESNSFYKKIIMYLQRKFKKGCSK